MKMIRREDVVEEEFVKMGASEAKEKIYPCKKRIFRMR